MRAGDPWRRLLASLPAALLLLLGGCAAQYQAGTGQRDGVAIHAWTPVSKPAQAAWQGPRTLLYTYVLSGDAAGGGAAPASVRHAKARQALGNVLREVQSGQSAASLGEAGLLRQANQFVIPARDYSGGDLGLEHYDFALSAGFLNRVRVALNDEALRRRLDQLGPFLIATLRPLNEQSVAADGMPRDSSALVMLVDMSGAHPEAMAAYINGFKDAVRKTLPGRFQQLSPLRAEFASLLLKTNEALPFIAEAYADTNKMLSTMGGTKGE